MEKKEYREIDIPALIRYIRKEEGMTQKEFAETFGFKESSPSMWELGEREAPYKILGFVFSRWLDKELDKAREEERRRMVEIIEGMKYKGDTKKFKHIKTTYDCKAVEEYIWFIGSMTLNRVLSKLKQ